jgi:autotransporter strand-loop-strand O-heptosyltransferase
MGRPKVYAHGSYIGNTGYNHHTRDFFRSLSEHADIKVRNFTVGDSWNGYNLTPHEGENYLNELDRKLLYQQILWDQGGVRTDYPMYSTGVKEFEPDVNLILCETNHYIFYDSYSGPKIAYNVWESTLQPEEFFNKLLEYDQLWVPSKWQKECTVKQGYPEDRIKVVPEGVDTKTFYPEEISHPVTSDGRFKFALFGRWDYRKSTKEILETFLKTFNENDPVDIIVSIDNMWGDQMDGYKTTEERLEAYNLIDPRIKILHFPTRKDYIEILKSCHVFVSCARSEGWNLPLIEAMACGVPSIYSNCSAQLEFAEGKGIPVNIIGEKPADQNDYGRYQMSDLPGNYYEPDFNDLSIQMRRAYSEYDSLKKKALIESEEIRKNFNWERVAEIGKETIEDFLRDNKDINPISKKSQDNKITISYQDGPRVEINGDNEISYFVEFIDSRNDDVIHSSLIKNNEWTACSRKYYTPWKIKINGELIEELDLKDKRVLISMESKSIGDTIAWAPYAVDFSEKHGCKVILSTFHNSWFKGLEKYKDIEFINPGESTICNAIYRIGWMRSDSGNLDRFDCYPNYPNTQELQKTASDILGLEFKELNYGINFKPSEKRPYEKKYVILSPESTTGCKEWVYDSWVSLSKMLKDYGLIPIVLTDKKFNIDNVICINGKKLDEVTNILYHAEFLIGLSSGLSWINWSLGKHTVMISGFTPKNHEFSTNITRIQNEHACNSCWSNINFKFDPGNWNWCPIWEGTEKQHICQKSISPLSVFNLLPI